MNLPVSPRAPIGLGRSGNLLTLRARVPLAPRLTAAQARADALVSSFVDHATDGYALAGMVGGGLVYRLGRVGTMAIGSRLVGATYASPLHALVRLGSIGIGFTGEVFAFEAGQRALRVGIGGADPNLLNWSGENGLGRGLVGAAITLGPLKGAGVFAQGQNLVIQHLFQDSAMVLAHNISDRIFTRRGDSRIAPTLAEQFVEAEATLWQMNAGMSLVHGAFPTLGQMDRGLDLSIRARDVGAPLVGARQEGQTRGLPLHLLNHPLLTCLPAGTAKEGGRGRSPLLAAAGIFGRPSDRFSEADENPLNGPQILQMSQPRDRTGRSGRRRGDDIHEVAAETVPLRSREEVRSDLEAVTVEIEKEVRVYDHLLRGMREVIRQNRRNVEMWEIYDRLLLKHSAISRKYQIGVSSLVDGGGAAKWEVSRIEGAVASLRRAVEESRDFRARVELPRFSPTARKPLTVTEKSYEENARMFRQLGLDRKLVSRILKMIPEEMKENHLVLVGLEGLNGLLDGRPRDERQAVISLLERLSSSSSWDSFRELLTIIYNFQLGLLSRDETLSVIRPARDFYESYPSARGPFIELFARRALMESREAKLVEAPLHFARQHLEQGHSVTMEPRSSIGYGTMIVETSPGDALRYAVGGILREVRGPELFMEVGNRLAREILQARERDAEQPDTNRLYIEIPRLGREVSPQRIRLWGRMLLENARITAINALTETSVKEHRRRLDPSERNVEALERIRGEWRSYWESFPMTIEKVEVGIPGKRSTQIVTVGEEEALRTKQEIQIVTIRQTDPRSKQMILGLQTQVAETRRGRDPQFLSQVLDLAHMLRDTGRRAEAVELVRGRAAQVPHKRIRELYRDMYLENLEEVFDRRREGISIFDPALRDFFALYFDQELTESQLRHLFTLRHFEYELGRVTAERHGEAIRLTLPVGSVYPSVEHAGDFVLDIFIPKNETTRWRAQLSSARVGGQGQGIAVCVLDRIIEFLQDLNVDELLIEADEIGKYAWLRMGGDFVDPTARRVVLNQIMIDKIPVPADFRPQTASSEQIAQVLTSLSIERRRRFLERWVGMPIYRFDLRPESPNLQRFDAYYESRAGTHYASKKDDPDAN